MSAHPGLRPADRRPPSTRECQQLDMSESLQDWGQGHPDRPLSFRWKADYKTLSRMLDLPACKSRRGERAMASIVFDAALSAREDPERRISYSRRKAFYSAVGRYDGTDYGYETVVPAIDALVEAGLLIDHDKVQGRPGGTGVQSSFRAAPDLANIVLPRPDYRVGEIIRLKDSNGTLVGYRDTERTARDRRALEAVNRHIANADIRLAHINGVTVDEDAGTIFFPGFLQWLDEGFGDHTVYTRMNALYRVYNGGWALGGRFYGGWWQQVRGCDRQHLLIDGSETIEHDYEMLHPRLLYASAGQTVAGDAYTLDDWDRKVCKRAFNILLNAGSYQQALGAILPHVHNNRRKAVALIAEMKKRHAPVASSFHSGAGLRLQNVDAEMVKSVLRDLTLRDGITVLPIHDSFVVQKEHQTALEEAMDEALAKATSRVGDQQTVSKGWSGIYPHRGSTAVQDGPAVPDHSGVDAPVAHHPGGNPSLQDIPSSETSISRKTPMSLAAVISPLTHGIGPRATSPSTTMGPTFDASSKKSPTPSVPDSSESDIAMLTETNMQQPESRHPAVETTIPHAVKQTPPTVIQPPAFLDPANRNKVAMANLRRAADRPLTELRTLDLMSTRKRRSQSSQTVGRN